MPRFDEFDRLERIRLVADLRKVVEEKLAEWNIQADGVLVAIDDATVVTCDFRGLANSGPPVARAIYESFYPKSTLPNCQR